MRLYRFAVQFQVSRLLFDLVWEVYRFLTQISIAFHATKWTALFFGVLLLFPVGFSLFSLRHFRDIPRHFRVFVVEYSGS